MQNIANVPPSTEEALLDSPLARSSTLLNLEATCLLRDDALSTKWQRSDARRHREFNPSSVLWLLYDLLCDARASPLHLNITAMINFTVCFLWKLPQPGQEDNIDCSSAHSLVHSLILYTFAHRQLAALDGQDVTLPDTDEVELEAHDASPEAWYSQLIAIERVWWYQAQSALLLWRPLLNEAPVRGPNGIEPSKLRQVISALPRMERIFMQTFLRPDFACLENLHVRARSLAHDLPTAHTRWLYHRPGLSSINAHGRVRRESIKETELLLHVIGVRRELPRPEMTMTGGDMFEIRSYLREYLLPWTSRVVDRL